VHVIGPHPLGGTLRDPDLVALAGERRRAAADVLQGDGRTAAAELE
jgi:hypothetical protein